jgi:adenylosuccinate synthase
MLKTAYIIVDLGFGDAGKGSIVDYLVQTRNANAVVRYTGGPHAAHHVVRSDGLSHAFCQFGATFKPGVRSHLAGGVIVKPENLVFEGRALQEKGSANPFARLSINPICRLVTSYHAMLCQMKEVSRGDQRFGTVGIGVGEAVVESEQTPELALRVGDLYEPETLRWKLGLHFEHKQCQAQAILCDFAHSRSYPELRSLYDNFMAQVRLKNVLSQYRYFAEQLPLTICSDREFIEQYAGPPGDIVFEGAHATLLDREYGYYPYVAKTDTTTNEALRILEQSTFAGKPFTIGVLRALGYRHGPGPFVTEDPGLSGLFEEKHNKANEWQGSVRCGWFDLLAVRHSIQINRRVDALALTMLDHLSRIDHFKVCLSYEYLGHENQLLEQYFEFTTTRSGRVKIIGIKPVPTRRNDELSRLLFSCVPWDWLCFEDTGGITDPFIHFLESSEGLGLPVQICSSGPTLSDKKERLPVA